MQSIKTSPASPYGFYIQAKARQDRKEALLASLALFACFLGLPVWAFLVSSVLASH